MERGRVDSKKKKIIKNSFIVLFVIYILLLFLVLLFKYPTTMVSDAVARWKSGAEIVRIKPQLVPFQTIVEYIKNVQAPYDWFFKNLACNLIMFIPYGFLLPAFWKNGHYRGLKIVISGCILSIVIEVLQYITAFGQMDIDDVILNTLGVVIGYELFRLIKYWLKK